MPVPVRLAILADDLIWSSRLSAAVDRAGARPVVLSAWPRSRGWEVGVAGALVDLGGRGFDALEALDALRSIGVPTVAVAQHDDQARRKQALAAGAWRVYSYAKLFRDGPAVIGSWLERLAGPSGDPPAIPESRYAARLDAARQVMVERDDAAALLIGPGADLRWLTGYGPLPLERLTMLVVRGEGPALLLVPRLEVLGARECPGVRCGAVEVATWEETEDPYGRVGETVTARGQAAGAGLTASRPRAARARLLVSQPLWALHLLRLQAVLPEADWGLAAEVLRSLRMVKDAEEIDLLRAAGRAADTVVTAIAAGRLVGRTERDIGREVRERLVDAGHDEAAFAIVASGPFSAEPHHEPGERQIEAGEPIVLDIGGVRAGYCSDTTRTLWPTAGDTGLGPGDDFRRLYAALEDAQSAATAAVRPGVPAEAIDRAARERIEAAGFGPQFIHRTGHGIGLEVHEEPYLVAGNHEPLAPGNVFSVEPGIYVEGRHGARIEDIVACGPGGPDVLNVTTRDLLVVTG